MLSLMDKFYKPDMSLEEAMELVDKCIAEVRMRLVVSPPNFLVKIVDKDGARELAWFRTVGDAGEGSSTEGAGASPMRIEVQG